MVSDEETGICQKHTYFTLLVDANFSKDTFGGVSDNFRIIILLCEALQERGQGRGSIC